VAAVVLFSAGGFGAWLLLRPSHSVAPANQAASAPENPSATQAASQPEKPAAPGASLSASSQPEPAAVSSAAPLRSAVRTDARSEIPAVQPAAAKPLGQPAASPSASVPPTSASSASAKSAELAPATEASQRPVLDIGKMAAPSVKRKASSSVSSEAPPEVLAQSEPLGGSALNDSLLSTSARGSGPSAPSSSPSAPANGGQLVQPKLISSPAALYPTEARSAHIQGDVAVDAFIDETGRVTATKVISGPPVLQQAAMNAVRSWKYQPARLDGRPISIHIRVNVRFQIQ
jgi:TonB family protein